MCLMEKAEPQDFSLQNLRSDSHAFSQNSLGGPHSEGGRIYRSGLPTEQPAAFGFPFRETAGF